MNNKTILFYGHTNGPYACFSNFYPVQFEHNGLIWANSEQAFVYYKSNEEEYQKKVKKTKDPYDVKRLGRTAKLVRNWDDIKFEKMCIVLFDKFSQNEDIKQILLSTFPSPIHEDCRDPWWGGGPNYPQGKDLLGKALCIVRNQLISLKNNINHD